MLEREGELRVLAGAARDAARGAGSVALVFGEAGIGKSSLVEAARAVLPAEGRMLIGYCDDLATKRTLGPFRDLVGRVGVDLARALRGGADRDEVLAALRAELDWAGHPTVLVVEDVHWADEATLDALRYVVRRVAELPAVLLLTYRVDELTRDHPVQGLIGLASGAPRVHRLPLSRLSVEAVRKLGADRTDADEVYAVTSGNPFFVAEVLAWGEAVPPTVVDAVLARVHRLDRSTQDALEQLAAVPSALDRWLVDALVPDGLGELAAAEQRGLLGVTPDRVAFRHELTRRAVLDSVPAARRVELHARVLAALVERGEPDLSRLMHHAAEAGDVEAIARYGPDAARDAAQAGAHREAIAHYRLVLRQRDRFPPAERADLLRAYAVEMYTAGVAPDAVAVQRAAVELRRELGDPGALGADLRWLSRMHWWAGDRASAEAAATEAIAVLEAAGDDRALALALSNQSQLDMLANRTDQSIALGERAVALATSVGDAAILAHALTNIGTARWNDGDPAGRAAIERALRIALDAGEHEHAIRAYANIIWTLLDFYQLAEAEPYMTAALPLAERAEHIGFLSYLHVSRGRLELGRGEWEAAERSAEAGVGAHLPAVCAALTVQGTARVRRGQPGGDELLARAWELAVRMDELQRLGPVAAARAEAAWLTGDHAAARAIAGPVYDDARRLGNVAWAAELGFWLTVAGQPVPPLSSDHPYAVQAAGRWREAAQWWGAAGCPYERALALSASDGAADLLDAVAELDRLGAEPLARIVRGRLRDLGVSRVPRGPVEATRTNPAGLTSRQVEVVRLLGAGLTNTEIAERLVVSPRTVDAHVAAVLGKLGAHTRQEAAARAAELGIFRP
ncbi:ATP-binding protein [Phytohabitans rumicis]|nr:AAA family ATPase [Phytohabitans rumicis]